MARAGLCLQDVYKMSGNWSRLRYVSDHCNRETFAESLRLVNIEYEELGSEIHDLLIDGDRVAVHRTIRMRNRGAGAAVNLDEWDCFRFRERLVAEFAAYVDVARLDGLEKAATAARLNRDAEDADQSRRLAARLPPRRGGTDDKGDEIPPARAVAST